MGEGRAMNVKNGLAALGVGVLCIVLAAAIVAAMYGVVLLFELTGMGSSAASMSMLGLLIVIFVFSVGAAAPR
jgi:hypothetical protein